ncbi:MAG: TonB-dependent receptor, partial [Lentisphaeraceae bacterium]|nr:TonB-dependent receptor [Lentisphaeraceae bacterium]
GKARRKAHNDFIHNNFRAWLRYTKGGLNYLAPRHRIEALGSFDMSKRSTFYQQLSLQVEYEKDISDTLSLRLDSGYDWTQIGEDRGDLATPLEHFLLFAEEEINSRVSLFWTPAVAHSFAFAVAHSREHFADDLLGIFGDNSYKSGSKVSSWHVDTFSLLSEYQWQLNSEWTFFLGGRGDRHKFSNWMWSPKIAIVHTPDENNSLKLIYNRSVRKTDDHVLRDLILSEAIDQAETETIESLELRLDHQHNDEYKVALSTFYYSHDVIAFLPLPINRVAPLGNAEAVGFELEVEYKGPSHEFIFSHAYTHLLNFTLEEDFVNNQVISSEPYGFGNEFQNWSPHITKFNWLWRLNDKFELNSSMQIMWAFPGASDYTDYNNNVLDKNNRSRSDGRQNAFNASIYLHSGLSYKQNEQVTWRLQAHNILGWLDKDFNKRNFYARLAGYRDQAAAVSISLEYKF